MNIGAMFAGLLPIAQAIMAKNGQDDKSTYNFDNMKGNLADVAMLNKLGGYQPQGGGIPAQHLAAVGNGGFAPLGAQQLQQNQQPLGQWNGNVLDRAQSFFPMGGNKQAPVSRSSVLDELMKEPAADFKPDDYQFLFKNQPRYYSHTPTGRLYE